MEVGEGLGNDERETHLSLSAGDRTMWDVFTDDPVMSRKLESIGAQLIQLRGRGRQYRLPANQVTLRKPVRRMTTPERKAAAVRLAAARMGPE